MGCMKYQRVVNTKTLLFSGALGTDGNAKLSKTFD